MKGRKRVKRKEERGEGREEMVGGAGGGESRGNLKDPQSQANSPTALHLVKCPHHSQSNPAFGECSVTSPDPLSCLVISPWN